MLSGCSRIVVFALLLAFSAQLLASAMPPCHGGQHPMSDVSESAAFAENLSQLLDSVHQGMDHSAMNHADINHGAKNPTETCQSENEIQSQVMAAMDCCEPDGQCNMVLCLMAPSMPSSFALAQDKGQTVKHFPLPSATVIKSASRLYHPPRFA